MKPKLSYFKPNKGKIKKKCTRVRRCLTVLCHPNTMTHSEDQNKEQNDAKDPDKNSIPKGYVQRNITNRSVIRRQESHNLIYASKYNKLTELSYTGTKIN